MSNSSSMWLKIADELKPARMKGRHRNPLQVFVMVIEHRHGADITTHRTELGAMEQANQYAEDWWPTELKGLPRPSNRADAREAYFKAVPDETYRLECCVVGD